MLIKKLILLISVLALLVIVVLIDTQTTMDILLLDSNSRYGSGSSGSGYSYNNENSTYSHLKSSSSSGLVSGLAPSWNEGGVNLFYLLQNATEVKKESYEYQLLEIYSNMSAGKYNDFSFHASPDSLAGSHANETNCASFVAPNYSYGNANPNIGFLGQTVNGKVITLENATKSDVQAAGYMRTINDSSSGGVWVNRGSDSLPDGPTQIENSARLVAEMADKTRPSKEPDIFSLIDALNFSDKAFSDMISGAQASGVYMNSRVAGGLSGLIHNRGSVGTIMFGFPYSANGSGKLGASSTYLTATSWDSLNSSQKQSVATFLGKLYTWVDNSNIPLEHMVSTQNGRGIGALVLLKNGGYLDQPLSSASSHELYSAITKLDNKVIDFVFPGKSTSTIIDYLNSNYVKKPWDAMGISQSSYSEIYGLQSQYNENYSHDFIYYIEPEEPSDIYRKGSGSRVVRAFDAISLGYVINTGMSGVNILLTLAQKAGIKSLTDGSIVDSSNPSVLYNSFGKGQYNPAGIASGDFGAFLDELNLNNGILDVMQQAQLQVLYDWAGGDYADLDHASRRGRDLSPNSDKYYFDCSAYMDTGRYLITKAAPVNNLPNGVSFTSTAQMCTGALAKSVEIEYKGQVYNARCYQLDLNGNPLPLGDGTVNKSMIQISDDWKSVLKTGDILVCNSAVFGGPKTNHTVTFVGVNNTSNTITVPLDVSKVDTNDSKIAPGAMIAMASKTSGKKNGVQSWTSQTKKCAAFRIEYNLK